MQTITIALQQSQYVIIALGSAQNERSLKNPFLAEEREQMILSNFSIEDQARILFVHIIDVYNDQKWVKQVQEKVQTRSHHSQNIGLIGHFKDQSSYYLQLFPDWKLVELESLENAISATPLRNAYFEGLIKEDVLPLGTINFLKNFKQTTVYGDLKTQYLNTTSSKTI